MMRSGSGHFLSRSRGFGVASPAVLLRSGLVTASASEQLLTLATDDGWTALYDPTNEDTRTLRADGGDQYITANADGLENAGDQVQSTAANQAQLSVGQFGELDAGLNAATGVYEMGTSFPTLEQPFYYVAVIRFTALGDDRLFTAGAGRLALTLADGTLRQSFGVDLNSPAGAVAVGTDYIISFFANGANSEIFVNSASVVTGDAGASSFAPDGDVFWWGNEATTRVMEGYFGPVVLGKVSSAEHTAMLDKLHDLTGIAKA